MSEPSEEVACKPEESIEEILRQQEALNQVLKDRFKKQVTIVFTDICGYTHYMETMGDLKGRAMVQKHNDIVFAPIHAHGGRVIKTIGDAVMATFPDPLTGVRAAVDIQKALAAHNQAADPADRIKVKIGINHGEAIVDDKDLFGDAVNVAARVQAKAVADEILVSENMFKIVCGSDDILCRFHTTAALKGKAEPMPLYRVVWQDEDRQLKEHQTRSQGAAPSPVRGRIEQPVFHLEVTREDQRIKLSAYEQKRGEASTVRHYEETTVSMEAINARCREIVETLNKANRSGRISRETLTKLRSIGQVFSDELFTAEVKRKLQQTTADHLVITMDDQLVQVPWELLNDGQHFLCQRFAMGRLVKTRQSLPVAGKVRQLARPLKMLVLADPRGDLKGAYEEGQRVVSRVDRDSAIINAALRSEGITPDYIKEKIRNFDIIHFAGHSDYDAENPQESGWRLSDGRFKADDIRKMAGTAAMPALIFANACQSARTEEWGIHDTIQGDIFGLANAFVLAGVKHYIGTFWEILDEPSSRFAEEFYNQVLSGQTVGEAMRLARKALIVKYGEETIVWGSYLLYGDPTYNYLDQVRGADPAPPADPAFATTTGGDPVRTDAEEITYGSPAPASDALRKVKSWVVIAAVAAVLLGAAAFFLIGTKPDTTKAQAALEMQLAAGRHDEAAATAQAIIAKDATVRAAYLALGNIQLKRGELDAARSAFEKAMGAESGTEAQKVQALMGLGRIASMKQDGQASIGYYRQAASADPNYTGAYVAQAMVAERGGDAPGALKLLEQAVQLSPKDSTLAAMTVDLRKKVAFATDKEKRERIDTLVKELLAGMNSPDKAADLDGWTSKPLTLWVMDFDCSGFSLQEGMPRLLTTALTENLLEDGRIQVVERALLDKLMEELKLGTSQLADQRTALALGRIAAARLIVSPKAVFGPEETQVSLRVFETETSRVAAAVNEAFDGKKATADITGALAGEIRQKINQKYPVRGRVQQSGPDGIALNIGDSVGVKEGRRFKVIGAETILEVVATEAASCIAKVVEGENNLAGGERVQGI